MEKRNKIKGMNKRKKERIRKRSTIKKKITRKGGGKGERRRKSK